MSATERTEWDERYRSRDRAAMAPVEPFVVEAVTGLETVGTAVDLAGGSGRHALWLASRGWDTTLVDISPVAIDLATAEASVRGLDLAVEALDMDAADPAGGPWDLVLIHHYLSRALLARVHRLVRPGGALVMAHQTLVNLERNDRPSARYLLAPHELRQLLGRFDLVRYTEGWTAQGRHEAHVVARLGSA